MKLVIDDKIPFIRGVFEPYAEVVYLPGSIIDARTVRDADGLIIRTRTRCDAALLKGSKVRIIATATIGFDHIDMNYCRRNGITATTAAGCNARGVAQWVFAALQAMDVSPESGTLGIIGVGNVGNVVRDVARGAGLSTLCCDPPRQTRREAGTADFVSRQELLEQADIVTVHVALDDTTRGMVNASFLRQMKPNGLLLNSSRGEVIDETALKDAIRNNHLRKTALDVWTGEPDIDNELLQMVHIATPHIAGYTQQGKAMGTAMSVRAVSQFLELPIAEDWYPEGALRQTPKNNLSWREITDKMKQYYDIEADDRSFRSSLGDFEKLRNNYNFRPEFF